MSAFGKLNHRAARRAENLLYRMGGLPITLAALRASGTDVPSRIRLAYARRYWRVECLGQALEIACAVLLWPVAVGLGSLYLTWANGAAVKKRCGRSRLRQWLDQLRLAGTHGILPPWYYMFALHDGDRAPHAATFLNRCETKRGAFPLIREPDDRTVEFDDKALFADLCRRFALPTVPVLATVESGAIRWKTDERLPAIDLFVKPVDGCGGKGAERWDCRDGVYCGTDAILTQSQLIDRLERKSWTRPLLVQPRVINHPALRFLSNGALSTVRVVTCLDERGVPEIMGAVCRMAIGANRTVDNFHAGGIASRVDLDSGRLSKATDMGLSARTGWLDTHPDTHAILTGRTLPDWPAIRALALDAHAAFAHHVFVGWDIALLADGLCLVEGNGGPDVDVMQRHSERGMMVERFGELLAWHLDRKADGLPVPVPAMQARAA